MDDDDDHTDPGSVLHEDDENVYHVRQELNLRNCNREIAAIARKGATCVYLPRFFVNANAFRKLLNRLPPCVTTLYCRYTIFDRPRHWQSLIAAIKRGRITALLFSECNIYKEPFIEILNAIRDQRGFTELCFSRMVFAAEPNNPPTLLDQPLVDAMAQALAANTDTLTEFIVNYITPYHCATLFNVAPQLRVAHVAVHGVHGDHGIREFADELSRSQLEVFTLGVLDMSTVAANKLLHGVSQMKQLHSLSIPDYTVGLDNVKLVLLRCPKLEALMFDEYLNPELIPNTFLVQALMAEFPVAYTRYPLRFIAFHSRDDGLIIAVIDRLQRFHSNEGKACVAICSAYELPRLMDVTSPLQQFPSDLIRKLHEFLF